jgi:hypothetical protein
MKMVAESAQTIRLFAISPSVTSTPTQFDFFTFKNLWNLLQSSNFRPKHSINSSAHSPNEFQLNCHIQTLNTEIFRIPFPAEDDDEWANSVKSPTLNLKIA